MNTKKKIDASLIDKAYALCESMFDDKDKFKKYWEDNYVKFIEDFAASSEKVCTIKENE